jgi:tRNA nucleotidyltransferase (CCA-adding enzyme)
LQGREAVAGPYPAAVGTPPADNRPVPTHSRKSGPASGAVAGDEIPVPLVRDVMCPKPVMVRPDDTLARAVGLMDSLGTRELVVAEGGRVVGILTRTDLQPHHGQYEWTLVRTAMTRDPDTVPPDVPVAVAARLLVDHAYNCLPVLADGRLVGMLRRSDLLQAIAR